MKRKSLDYYLSLNYKISVQHESMDDERWFIAYCNELGKYACYGKGASPEEAVTSFNIEKEVFIENLYFENKNIPEPFIEDETIKYSGMFNVRTTPEMHSLLIYQASISGVSLNKFVNTILSFNAGVHSTAIEVIDKLTEIKNTIDMHHSFVSDKLKYSYSTSPEERPSRNTDVFQYAAEHDYFYNKKAS